MDYLSVWYGSPYCHTVDPASASESFLVCGSIGTSYICVGTSSIYVAIGISGRFERHLSK